MCICFPSRISRLGLGTEVNTDSGNGNALPARFETLFPSGKAGLNQVITTFTGDFAPCLVNLLKRPGKNRRFFLNSMVTSVWNNTRKELPRNSKNSERYVDFKWAPLRICNVLVFISVFWVIVKYFFPSFILETFEDTF